MGGRSPRTLDGLACGVLLLIAARFVYGVLLPVSARSTGFTPYDTYAYFYPHIMHALRSVEQGGGLLWNPFQACGQPFFALGLTGLLYPVNWLFAFMERESGLLLNTLINLTIAGVGMYALCRELGAGRVAALYGAAAFQLSGSALHLASWSPMHIPAYAWLPIAFCALERLLRSGQLRDALLLSIALGVQILPGFPQIVLFTYQIIALRIGWGLLMVPAERRWALARLWGFALILPVFLVAVQFFPNLELVSDSVRGGGLPDADIGEGLSVEQFQYSQYGRAVNPIAIAIVTPLMGLIAFCGGPRVRRAAFFGAVALLYFALAWGPGTPVFDLYANLPMGSLFRKPQRFVWICGFALSVLVSLGVARLLEISAHRPGRQRAAPILAMTVGIVAFAQFVRPLRPLDWVVAIAMFAVASVLLFGPRRLRPVRLALPILLIAFGALTTNRPVLAPRAGDLYFENEAAFDALRVFHATSNDRALIVGTHPDFALLPKSGTVFGVPNIGDYEPMTRQSFAEYFVFMRTGRPMNDLLDWYRIRELLVPGEFRRPLLDLAAGRFLVVDHDVDRTTEVFGDELNVVTRDERLTIYENPDALPRAFFVSQAVVAERDQILPWLARGDVEPRRLAFVDHAPASGFTGATGSTGTVRIVRDDPEHLEIAVSATAAGFVFLADQFDPGWRANVNGHRAEVLRTNYTFRMVEVPAGESVIDYRYRPTSLVLGAGVSIASWTLLLTLWVRSGPRRSD